MFEIVNKDEKIKNKDLYKRLPELRIKFKEDKCSCGNKSYSYADLTKVKIESTKTKFNATPICFTDYREEKDVIVDYAPVYIIGVLELLHLAAQKKEEKGTLVLKIWSGLTKELAIFNSYEKIEEQRKRFNDSGYINEPLYNLLLQMRTDYTTTEYNMIMQFIPAMLLCYESDKRRFFEVLFEALGYSTRLFTAIIPEMTDTAPIDELNMDSFNAINKELRIREQIKVNWLNKTDDLHFQRIKYKAPDDNWYSITDCRGFCILQTIKFYYYLLDNHAERPSKDISLIDFNNAELYEIMSKKILNCLGNDTQSVALKGEQNTLYLTYRGQFTQKSGINFEVPAKKGKSSAIVAKGYYEDVLLFKKAYDDNATAQINVTENEHLRDYSMHYIKFGDILGSIITTVRGIDDLQTDVEAERIKTLEDENKQLRLDLNRVITNFENLKKEVQEKKELKSKAEQAEKLEKELEDMRNILASKNKIISTQVEELSQLHSQIGNMYNDEAIEEMLKEAEETDLTIEEMVDVLNSVTTCFIGGFANLEQKCKDIGWTNITQINFDTNVLTQTIPTFDFFCIFTKFVSHKLVRQVQSKYKDIKNRVVYYNGVNVELLIKLCYKMVDNFLNK